VGEVFDILVTALIGLSAGVIGGMAGIGGSIIMLPGLGLLLGFSGAERVEQHSYMAAAMMVNALVAAPAAVRHHKSKAVRFDVAKVLLPAMGLAIIAGVLLSNRFDGVWLTRLLAVFIALYCVSNLVKIALREGEHESVERSEVKPGRTAGVGAVTGMCAGLLGIGGGVIMVPLLQTVARVPLREAIGTSSAVMCITAVIGAAFKVGTLGGHGLPIVDAVALAALMGPSAMLGAWLGAKLTHALPLAWVRGVISVVLLAAAAKLAGLL